MCSSVIVSMLHENIDTHLDARHDSVMPRVPFALRGRLLGGVQRRHAIERNAVRPMMIGADSNMGR
jgi:hypothetical protein